MPKLLSALVIAILVVSAGGMGLTPASATAVPIRVIINGVALTPDVPPVIRDGRVLVPFRAIFEALGAQVGWDAATNVVSGFLGRSALFLEPGQRRVWRNGSAVQIDVPPAIVQGRTMVPVRFVAESLGATVEWVEAERLVRITAVRPTVPPRGGALRIGTTVPADNLNPLLANSTTARWVNSLVNPGLVRFDEQGVLVNSLADRWSWDEAGLTLRLWLRRGVRWHDGRDFTAADVKFTYDTLLTPNFMSSRKGEFAGLTTVTVIDSHTIDFRLSSVNLHFLSRLTMGIIPQHVFAGIPVNQMAAHAFSRAPVGTGPFVFDTAPAGQNIVLRRFDAYHLEKAHLDSIEVRLFADTAAKTAAWERAEIDWHTAIPPLSVSQLQTALGARATFQEVSVLQYEAVVPNMANRALADRRVRQALMFALDRPAMLNAVLGGRGSVMQAYQLPGSLWALGAGLDAYTFNRTRATQLFSEAGFRTAGADGIRRNAAGDRLSFTLLVPSGHHLRGALATALRDSWRQIGVEARVETPSTTAFFEAIGQRRFDLVLNPVESDPQPDPFLNFHSSQGVVGGQSVGRNIGNWNDAAQDRLMETVRRTTALAERRNIYHQLEVAFNRDLPVLPLFHVREMHGVHNRVGGMVWGVTGPVLPEAIFIRR